MPNRKSERSQRRTYCKQCQQKQKDQVLSRNPERMLKLKAKLKRAQEKVKFKRQYGVEPGTVFILDQE